MTNMPEDNSGEDDMEPYNGPEKEPDTRGVDPDLVREELEQGSCTSHDNSASMKTPKTAAALALLGAGQPYKSTGR